PVQFRPAQERLPLRLERVLELPDEIDALYVLQLDRLMLAIQGQQIDHVPLSQHCGVQVAFCRRTVEEDDHHFLMSRGWAAVFHRIKAYFWLAVAIMPQVMLSLCRFLSTCWCLKG